MVRRACLLLLLASSVLGLTPPAALAQSSYQLFEADQSRPVALSPDGSKLFAVNTPDDELEIFDVEIDGSLTWTASVHVGMRPVAVGARTNGEVWVVNQLSDSVSVVQLSPAPRVTRTLLVGDEPRDIVFAGPQSGGFFTRAFVTTAHRGQNHDTVSGHNEPKGQFTSEGIGRADVYVFDAASLGNNLRGSPLTVISLFGDKPRALAIKPDGTRVYAAIFHSGNRTTTLNEGFICTLSQGTGSCTINGNVAPGPLPPPNTNHAPQSIDRPDNGLIVKFNRPGGPANTWSDELDRNWNDFVNFSLPDIDVFEINATGNPPGNPPFAINGGDSCTSGNGCWQGVGTTLFNMIVNPDSQKLYVSNTEAQNHVRFEGPGIHAATFKPPGEPPTVQGNLAQSRITVLNGANVDVRHLNKHIDYSIRPAPAGVPEKSLSTPMGMAITPDGNTLYLAAFGSNKIGIFDTAQLENNTFVPSATDHIPLLGGGPAGMALQGNHLYVLTRFDNTLRVVNRITKAQLQAVALYNPEPPDVTDGRPFLYDATLTSSNGEASCASCHIGGDMDDLSWDLGNPDDDQVNINGNVFRNPPGAGGLPTVFHPMKGPMATQTLRGLATHGAQHWRGDRQGDGDSLAGEDIDAILGFEAFNPAFVGLVGRASQLADADMTAYREFALLVRQPPNPMRQLSNAVRVGSETSGETLYNQAGTDIVQSCNGCHVLDSASGFFGSDGKMTFEGETQLFKIAHLRNQYQKVGMFGLPNAGTALDGPFTNTGPQIRGSGFLHDGSIDTDRRFHSAAVFQLNPTQQNQLEEFMMVFPSDLAPVVGQQVTHHTGNFADAATTGRIDLLQQRANAIYASRVLGGNLEECDLVAKLVEGGSERGYLYDPATDSFLPDDGTAAVPDASFRPKANVSGQEVSYTCVPPGSGARNALDRDEDTLLNGVETNTGVFVNANDTGSDPAAKDTDGDGFDDPTEVNNVPPSDPNDPLSVPSAAAVPSLSPAGVGALAAALLFVGGRASRRRRS